MNPAKKENPFVSLIFNVVAPVLILEKLSAKFTPTIALIIALALPIGYGLFDYIKTKNKNWMSIFGIVNILFTGGFALMKLEGIWFAVKEAAFPLVIGIGVLISAFTAKPLINLFIESTQVFNMDLIKQRLQINNTMMFFMLFVMWYFISGLKKLTGLTLEQFMPTNEKPNTATDDQTLKDVTSSSPDADS